MKGLVASRAPHYPKKFVHWSSEIDFKDTIVFKNFYFSFDFLRKVSNLNAILVPRGSVSNGLMSTTSTAQW